MVAVSAETDKAVRQISRGFRFPSCFTRLRGKSHGRVEKQDGRDLASIPSHVPALGRQVLTWARRHLAGCACIEIGTPTGASPGSVPRSHDATRPHPVCPSWPQDAGSGQIETLGRAPSLPSCREKGETRGPTWARPGWGREGGWAQPWSRSVSISNAIGSTLLGLGDGGEGGGAVGG